MAAREAAPLVASRFSALGFQEMSCDAMAYAPNRHTDRVSAGFRGDVLPSCCRVLDESRAAMNRSEVELYNDAVARWENEGGTIRPSSDGYTRIRLSYPPFTRSFLRFSMAADCQIPSSLSRG